MKADRNLTPAAASNVSEFCRDHRISRGFYYQLRAAGKGPQILKLGRRTLITREAAERWRAKWTEPESRREGA